MSVSVQTTVRINSTQEMCSVRRIVSSCQCAKQGESEFSKCTPLPPPPQPTPGTRESPAATTIVIVSAFRAQSSSVHGGSILPESASREHQSCSSFPLQDTLVVDQVYLTRGLRGKPTATVFPTIMPKAAHIRFNTARNAPTKDTATPAMRGGIAPL